MSFKSEFKEFISKGNVIDLAVGVVIGAAFGKIVGSFVDDIIMPPIGILMGNVDFADLKFILKEATASTKAVSLNYGVFINNILDFVIVAFCIFLVVKGMNSLKKKEVAAPAVSTTKECKQCLSQIPIKAVKCAFCTSAA